MSRRCRRLSAAAPSPMATSATTGTRPAEPHPQSRLGSPIASVGRLPSVAPPLQAARPLTRDSQREAIFDPVVPHHSSPSVVPPRARSRPRIHTGWTAHIIRGRARWRGPADSVAIDLIPPRAREALVDGLWVGLLYCSRAWRMCPRVPVPARVEADGYPVMGLDGSRRRQSAESSDRQVGLAPGLNSLPHFASPAKTPSLSLPCGFLIAPRHSHGPA